MLKLCNFSAFIGYVVSVYQSVGLTLCSVLYTNVRFCSLLLI